MSIDDNHVTNMMKVNIGSVCMQAASSWGPRPMARPHRSASGPADLANLVQQFVAEWPGDGQRMLLGNCPTDISRVIHQHNVQVPAMRRCTFTVCRLLCVTISCRWTVSRGGSKLIFTIRDGHHPAPLWRFRRRPEMPSRLQNYLRRVEWDVKLYWLNSMNVIWLT